ncbi:LysR substrate-binding domain-containing protein [Pseudomonas hefeiensis]|uniref:LysR substrate-binding domain-containing protein n=1 Tax=Pseudomonas hefeiensis TaxID=2738125 RepID=A0ABY9GHA5_9PSED|nr:MULTISPECIES: LysR substrate-binding domain-containing protein [unclassified Pseudomonas]WLH14859.1 LysR substrate-binding domain-containing protein [Pseudomonas sp. FP205]WLH97910.1 LysR substrate-binding domain-containing protein [Pseudomonas sp. FP53]WLI42185.1 LysR substrate-binding domain-containing protein [Pseudomonas sp. FP821]
MRELAGRPVVIVIVRLGSWARRLIDAAAARANVELLVAGEVAYLPPALWMAASGIGAAILHSIMSGDLAGIGLVARTLEEPVVQRDICVIARRGHSLASNARAFLETLRSLVAAPAAEDLLSSANTEESSLLDPDPAA